MLKKMRKRGSDGRHGLSGVSARMGAAPKLERARQIRVSLLGPLSILAPLALLGEWLIAHTHHRPLGAATFATFAVLVWMAFELTSRILFSAAKQRPEEVHKTKRVLSSMALLACAFVFARALL